MSTGESARHVSNDSVARSQYFVLINWSEDRNVSDFGDGKSHISWGMQPIADSIQEVEERIGKPIGIVSAFINLTRPHRFQAGSVPEHS